MDPAQQPSTNRANCATWFRRDFYKQLTRIPAARLVLPRELLIKAGQFDDHGRPVRSNRYRNCGVGNLKAIAGILAEHADDHTGHGACPSLETLGELLGLEERRIRYHLAALEYFGVIVKTHAARRPGPNGRPGRPPTYRMLLGSVGASTDAAPEVRATAARLGRRVELLQQAYGTQLGMRHGLSDYPPLHSVAVWERYVPAVLQLARDTGRTFGHIAGLVMLEFMAERGKPDGKLITRRHPPAWLKSYLSEHPSGECIIERVRARLVEPPPPRAPATKRAPVAFRRSTTQAGAARVSAAAGRAKP